MSVNTQLISATCIALAIDHDGPLCGVAFLGASGAGKSQTALSLLSACPFQRSRLISDDMTRISAQQKYLFATAAPEIAGAVELRGTGILAISHLEQHRLSFAFRLDQPSERQPSHVKSWAPLGAEENSVPEYRWTNGQEGMIFFLRAILSGHSSRAGFDSIPVTAGEGGFS